MAKFLPFVKSGKNFALSGVRILRQKICAFDVLLYASSDGVDVRATARPSSSAAEVEVEGQQQEEEKLKIWEEGSQEERKAAQGAERARDAEALMAEVFDAVSGQRRAYAALQGAHCPWDPDKMRAADAAVVAELRHLARLRDRFRRSAAAGHIPRPNPSAPPLCEAVAPYEATLDDLQRQLQSKQAEVDGLKEKLAAPTSRRNGRHHPSKLNGPGGAPTADLFTTCAEQARAATRAFAAQLLHLGRCSTRYGLSSYASVVRTKISENYVF
ncbi:protein GRAVITROPIC IN THE LIGHT 1-like [Panicum hallii]|uniref:protein GRAVITROPIC IN THE LIGHT 1-like n=1 Tax=Panicum hallii TaxID=206008 RepID=UPI000DF4E5E9|nr:protein GRAVITROPIC IN THE LIGHT 1-like [Panicum hallii]